MPAALKGRCREVIGIVGETQPAGQARGSFGPSTTRKSFVELPHVQASISIKVRSNPDTIGRHLEHEELQRWFRSRDFVTRRYMNE